MTSPVNSIVINGTDNVATAMEELFQGDVGRYLSKGVFTEIMIVETIPQYHKYAIRNIQKSENVRKYGEVIGQATRNIGAGAHVHVHNISSPGRNHI
jgi:altronate dehydratase small subunit